MASGKIKPVELITTDEIKVFAVPFIFISVTSPPIDFAPAYRVHR